LTGYLQRLALSSMKPGGSIQPVLRSLFSPPILAGESEALPEQTARLVTPPAPFQSLSRGHPPPLPAETTTQEVRSEEPRARKEESDKSIEITAPTLSRSPLPPNTKEDSKRLILPQFPEKNDHQPRQEALKSIPETTVAEPLKQTIEYQTSKIAPSESAKSSLITTSSRTPLVARSEKKAETLIKPRLSMNGGDEHRAGVPNLGEEAAVRAAPREESAEPSKKLRPETALVTQRVSTRERVRSPETEEEFGKAVARQDLRPVVRIAPRRSNPEADGKERMVSPSARGARKEPDEIQIHIGRIEVIAVPPAPPAPPTVKPKRGAPSLAEFLRRNRRAV
jgi:hypothetical protein